MRSPDPPTARTTRTYRITHSTVYRYDSDVSTSFGRAHLLPRDLPHQTCVESELTVSPGPDELREHTDAFGNRSTYFCVRTRHRALTVLASSTVTVTDRPAADPGGPAWDEIRDGLPTGPPARGYAVPSPRLPPDAQVTAYARPSFPPGRPLVEAAVELTTRIHRDFRYVTGATTVGSTVADLLDRREGVCQDFAHLAVAGLRAVGLPARYVSGYLETTPPPGRAKLVGVDASHAWVSVFTGDGWLDLDPTNDRIVDASYVELAHGRDYADVPPLKGVIFAGSAQSVLTVAVDMIRIGAASSAGP